MKVLAPIKLKDIIAIDIETVRYKEGYEELEEKWGSAWEYKQKQAGEIPEHEELVDSWMKMASLYAEFSKICAISIVFLGKSGKPMAKEFSGEDENEILQEAGSWLERMVAGNGDYRLVAHAGKYFDYPFMAKRFVVNRLSIPTILDTAHLKPWEQTNLDTNELWRMGGTGAGSSLQALCTVLEIPISKVDLVGDEVGKAYFEGNIDGITEYCTRDSLAVFNIIKHFKQDYDVIEFEDLKILSDEDKIEKPKLLDRIFNSGKVTKEDEKELLAHAKTLDKEGKEDLVTLFKASLGKKDKDLLKQEEKLIEKILK